LRPVEKRCAETEKAVMALYSQRTELQKSNRVLQEKVIQVETFLESNQGKVQHGMESSLANANIQQVELREELDDTKEMLKRLDKENTRLKKELGENAGSGNSKEASDTPFAQRSFTDKIFFR
jgi:chromosome segregation ATPase